MEKDRTPLVLAVDQGTSSTKSVIFDGWGRKRASFTCPLTTRYGEGGRAEQNPQDIYESVIRSAKGALEKLDKESPGDRSRIIGAGISNQRETLVLWDKQGRPVLPALLWQDKRCLDICHGLEKRGAGPLIRERTGLRIDPYFSGGKLAWLMEHHGRVRELHDRGELYFGTVESWLLYRLTGGEVHLTDHTNASRTLLFNINDLSWDRDLLDIFGVGRLNLPEIRPSAGYFASSDFNGLFPRPLPITAVAGDSHAALFGELCFGPGDAKATLGTGCSLMVNCGPERPSSGGGLDTIAFSAPGRVWYAKEGIIVSAGSVLTWLKDKWGFFDSPEELNRLDPRKHGSPELFLIPGHAGLGEPFWKSDDSGRIYGLRFDTEREDILMAALEAIQFQIRAVSDALAEENGKGCAALNIDGGISGNEFVGSGLADLLGVPVSRFSLADVSALGAGLLALWGAGHFLGTDEIGRLPLERLTIQPAVRKDREEKYRRWFELAKGE